MSGWFAVKRGITKHPLFSGKPERLAIWLWLLDNVAWKETTHDVQGKTVDIPRGSVCASTRHIAKECGLGHQVVRTALVRFSDELMINTEATHGKTIISLCNYEKYQSLEKGQNTDPNTAVTQQQHSTNTQKKQGNKVTREDTNVSSTQKRGSRLPEDWVLPLLWGEWATGEGWSDQAVRIEADKFRDYWTAKTGRDATKRDWLATWRNWMRNCKSPRVINGGTYDGNNSKQSTDGQSNRSDPALEQIYRLSGIGEAQGNGGV